VTEAGRQEVPDVRWPAIVGMRNRLVHAYQCRRLPPGCGPKNSMDGFFNFLKGRGPRPGDHAGLSPRGLQCRRRMWIGEKPKWSLH
jgi:hypothetical protein